MQAILEELQAAPSPSRSVEPYEPNRWGFRWSDGINGSKKNDETSLFCWKETIFKERDISYFTTETIHLDLLYVFTI